MGKPSRDKERENALARARYAKKIAAMRRQPPPRTEFGPEEWRPLPGFPDYEISNYGDVRRVTPAATRYAGHRPRGQMSGGYWAYKLVSPEGKKTVWAHRAVLEAFVGPPPSERHQCAHWDGNRLNNHISNLRWATPKENAEDRSRHGSITGERNPRAILTAEQVAEARTRYTGRRGQLTQLAKEYGVSRSAMWAALTGRNWGGQGQQV